MTNIADFDTTDLDILLTRLSFHLPEEYIAQTGAEPRDSSRLMIAPPHGLPIQHQHFRDLPQWLQAGDLLVFNESKVIPARVMARKPQTSHGGGGQVEVLLLREESPLIWSAYLKPARRAGTELWLGEHHARVEDTGLDTRLLHFDYDIKPFLDDIGRLPLPPYIESGDTDKEAHWRTRYQTVYAREAGSVAAPTAGLHFTSELLTSLKNAGIETTQVTLHVGAGTFKPITGTVSEHVMHAERYHISTNSAQQINNARREGRRIIAVGTTTVRTLESAFDGQQVIAGEGDTRIFITPPNAVHVPDLLITNLHLPHSTLLLLVTAFAGEDTIRAAYKEALHERYRFYSLGDAMLLYNSSR